MEGEGGVMVPSWWLGTGEWITRATSGRSEAKGSCLVMAGIIYSCQ